MKKLFLSGLLLSFFLNGFATVVYEKNTNTDFVSDFIIENPFGSTDIVLEMQGMDSPEFVVQTQDLQESVAHTMNFDELNYLSCGSLIDGLLYYNIEGREYFPENIGGDTLRIGFRFPSVGTTFYYGWMRVELSGNGSTFRLLDYAYQNEVDQSIVMCDIGMVPTKSIFSQTDIKIYPNPATHFIKINQGDSEESFQQIDVFTMEGRNVKSLQNQNSIDILDLMPGMYVCRITNNGEIIIRYFVKQ